MQCTDAAYFTDVARSVICMSVCLSVLGKRVTCAKTAEPIEMPFGGWLAWIQGTKKTRAPWASYLLRYAHPTYS